MGTVRAKYNQQCNIFNLNSKIVFLVETKLQDKIDILSILNFCEMIDLLSMAQCGHFRVRVDFDDARGQTCIFIR